MEGKVTGKFTELIGSPRQWSHRTTQLRDNNLYILINDQSDWKFIGCGFELTEDEYPKLTTFLEVQHKCGQKDEITKALETFCESKEDWTYQPPSDNNDYIWGYTDSIQDYLVEKLEELHQFRVDNPQLKWN
ncbi:hypothetical protein [Bacillus sp. V59.32b]|uniref:hypothetical protein n=1 Tax=Bacillus sp. V59.32b TaxID=1758642 RepID=UPI000E3BA651|nr:hypothetical protein [Bacillus sp. V59.32b]RFU60993.1 hypothetical protein D0463_15665 [Bacillus sp. V59.32b]